MNPNKRFIIDTNTLISAVLIKNSTPFKALELAHNSGILTFSDETFLEFETVLFRKKFDRYFSKEERLQIIYKLYNSCTIAHVTSDFRICRDHEDDKFLNLSTDASASCIVTGDNDLLVLHPFKGMPILSPFEFLKSF